MSGSRRRTSCSRPEGGAAWCRAARARTRTICPAPTATCCWGPGRPGTGPPRPPERRAGRGWGHSAKTGIIWSSTLIRRKTVISGTYAPVHDTPTPLPDTILSSFTVMYYLLKWSEEGDKKQRYSPWWECSWWRTREERLDELGNVSKVPIIWL